MDRKLYWGIAALVVVLIAAGGFMYWQWSQVQQLKEEVAQDKKLLEEENKPVAENELPPADPGKKWVPHGDHFHQVPIDAPHTVPIAIEVPAYQPPAIPTYDGPLTDHVKLIETHPVQALRLQAQERGHWSALWIPPFPADDQEAAEIAKAVYVWIDYYEIKGHSDKDPRPPEIQHAEQLLHNLNEKFYEEAASTRRADPRTCDLLKIRWARRDQPVVRPEIWPSTFDK